MGGCILVGLGLLAWGKCSLVGILPAGPGPLWEVRNGFPVPRMPQEGNLQVRSLKLLSAGSGGDKDPDAGKTPERDVLCPRRETLGIKGTFWGPGVGGQTCPWGG